MIFEFEPKSQRYRYKDTKQYISQEAIQSLREKAIAQSLVNARQSIQKMIDGDITVDEWEREFMANIKTRTIQLYQLGKPGQLDQTDRGKLGNQIRYQYDKLWNFRQAIIDGNLSEAQIKYRSELYLNKTRWAHEEGKRRSHYIAGYMWEKRLRNALDSCMQCITYAALGWQAIYTLARIGEACDCKANCKCEFVYSDSVVMPENSTQDILNRLQFSWFLSDRQKEKMKVTFNAPDTTAPQETIEEAIAAAQSAFNQSLAMDFEPRQAAIKETEDAAVEQSPKNFGHPSPEQLEKMNQFRLKGAKPFSAEEVVSVAFLGSNNLLHSSPEVWSINALRQMEQQFPGRPFTNDHNWYDVNSINGMVYDAELIQATEVPKSVLEKVDYDINHAIFQKDGYVQLILYVMFEAGHPIVDKLRFRRGGDVSTGTFVNTDKIICPHDGSYFGEGDYSYECAEGHTLPNAMLAYWWYDDDERERMADYAILDDNTDSIELSEVIKGNLPEASIITEA